MSGNISVEFRGQHFEVPTTSADTLEDVGSRIAHITGTAFQTLKLLHDGRVIVPSKGPSQKASSTGITAGTRLRLLASTEGEIRAVRSSRDLPGLAGFEQEAKRAAQRQRDSSNASFALPSGPYTFVDYKTWEAPGAIPGPEQALKLLHRLAADPGIVGIMRKHKWRVGLLSELPPEGKVGISPVCLLGLNVNAGQEIKLRLRTDDLQGFRRYQPIRETLVHELTHNVHGDHDNNFKALNSQLLREVKQYDIQSSSGQTLSGEVAPDGYSQAAQPGGQPPTAYRLGGCGISAANAAAAAAAAALQRQADLVAARASDIAGMGHRDAQTEAAERALARMGGSTVQQPEGQLPSPSQSPPQPPSHSANIEHPSSGQQSQPWSAAAASLPPARHSAPAPHSAAGMDVEMPDVAVAAASELQRPAAEPEPAQLATADRQSADMPAATAGAEPVVSAPQMQSQQQAAAAAAAGAAEADSVANGAADPDDEVHQRYERVRQVVTSLVTCAPSPEQARTALATLGTILQNALNAPEEARFRRVRQHNAAFQKRTSSLPEAVEILRIAGFVEAIEQQQPVLVLQRNDPGLLWLSLSAVQDQQVH